MKQSVKLAAVLVMGIATAITLAAPNPKSGKNTTLDSETQASTSDTDTTACKGKGKKAAACESSSDPADTGAGGGEETPTDPVDTSPSRSFHMGFTPWPYDATAEAINNTYDLIHTHGDIIAHHLSLGLPWEEAYLDLPYPSHVTNEIEGRLSRTLEDQAVFLAIDSLSMLRDELIGTWSSNGTVARGGDWSARSFDDEEVITAFINYSLDMIEQFQPDYFSYSTEISELMRDNPAGFDQFVVFAQQVYSGIKDVHPDLPLVVSLSLRNPEFDSNDTLIEGFARIADYVDVVGVSIYPYAFFYSENGTTVETLPDNWLSQVQEIAPGKALAITETGWAAENLDIPNLELSVTSDTQMQDAYVAKLLEEAGALDAQFVIWYEAVDFDAFWHGALGQDDLSAIWKDIGLYDEDLNPRAGLNTWQDTLDIPLQAN